MAFELVHTDVLGSGELDATLVAGCRDGRWQDYGALVSRYHKVVHGLAYHFLQHREEAEDASQEAFLQAFRSLRSLRDDAAFGPWLLRIATNVCIERTRQRKDVLTSLEDGMELPDPLPDPEATAVRRETRALLRRLILSLPIHYQAPLVLRDVEGHSYSEIAAALGVPEGTVKSRLSMARRLLRQSLTEAEE